VCVKFAAVAAVRYGPDVLSWISGFLYGLHLQRCAQVRHAVADRYVNLYKVTHGSTRTGWHVFGPELKYAICQSVIQP